MIPASIDRASMGYQHIEHPRLTDILRWKPRSKASKIGILSLRPKKGAARRGRRMNGKVGRNKKA